MYKMFDDPWDQSTRELHSNEKIIGLELLALEPRALFILFCQRYAFDSRPLPIVWDVAQITKEFGAEIIDEIPLCSGGDGPMVLKQGTKEGKEYRGWVCPTPKSGHPAKWMRVGSDGHWVFQK